MGIRGRLAPIFRGHQNFFGQHMAGNRRAEADAMTLSHHTQLTDLTAFDDHPQYLFLAGRAGGAQVITHTVATDGVLRVNALAGAGAGMDILSVEKGGTPFFRVAGDGQSYFTSSTTGGIINLLGNLGGTSLKIGTNPSLSFSPGGSGITLTLAGSSPNMTLAGTASRLSFSGVSVVDSGFSFNATADATKKLGLTLSGIATATTRTWTIGNYSGIPAVPADEGTTGLVLTAVTGAQPIWAAAPVTTVDSARTWATLQKFPDDKLNVVGSADATKIMRFEVDGFTTGTTRTLTPPDASFTFAAINLAQTFTKANVFTPDSDLAGLVVNEYAGLVTTDAIFKVVDVSPFTLLAVSGSSGIFALAYGVHVGPDLYIWPGISSGNPMGTGGSHKVASLATAARNFNLPNVSGTGMVIAGTSTRTNSALTTAITLVSTATNAAGGEYQVNLALANGSTAGDRVVQVALGWTDERGARTVNLIIGYALASTAASQLPTNAVYSIRTTASTVITVTPAFTSGTTGTYNMTVGASKVV